MEDTPKLIYITLSLELIEHIQSKYDVKLSAYDRIFIAIVNSFNSRGSNCTVGTTTFMNTIGCSRGTVSKVKNALKAKGIIAVWSNPDASEDNQIPDVINLSKELKEDIKQLFNTRSRGERAPRSCGEPYTNNSMGLSSTSLLDVSANQEKKKGSINDPEILEALNKINI